MSTVESKPSAAVLKIVDSKPSAAILKILKRGTTAIEKGYEGRQVQVEAGLELGRAAVDLRAAADKTKGGSTYAELVSQYWNLGGATASQLLSIGKSKKLFSSAKELPAAQFSLYLLSTLSDEQFEQGIEEGVINPEATRGKLQAFKHRLAPPVEEQKLKTETVGNWSKADADKIRAALQSDTYAAENLSPESIALLDEALTLFNRGASA